MPPTDIALSTSLYTPPLAANAVIATLSTTDANCCETFIYTITGGADQAKFVIVGSQLRGNVAGLTGNNLAVTITTDDQHGATYSKTFSISESA